MLNQFLVSIRVNHLPCPRKVASSRHPPILPAVLLCLSGFALPGLAPEQVPSQSLIQELDSPKWEVRGEAVRALSTVSPDRIIPEVSQKLISLLGTENKSLWNKIHGISSPAGCPPSGEAGEGWAEHYAEVLGVVLKLRDPGALEVLVGAAAQPSTVDRELAAYGSQVLPAVLERLRSLRTFTVNNPNYVGSDYQAQMAMADILAQIILLDHKHKLNPSLTASDYKEIREAARPLLSGPDGHVRFYAATTLALAGDSRDVGTIREVFARKLASRYPIERIVTLQKLAQISDPSFVPVEVVEDLAKSDPFNGPSIPGLNPLFHGYAVRRLASQVLQKFPKLAKPKSETR